MDWIQLAQRQHLMSFFIDWDPFCSQRQDLLHGVSPFTKTTCTKKYRKTISLFYVNGRLISIYIAEFKCTILPSSVQNIHCIDRQHNQQPCRSGCRLRGARTRLYNTCEVTLMKVENKMSFLLSVHNFKSFISVRSFFLSFQPYFRHCFWFEVHFP